MNSYFLSIPLPKDVRARLALLCYGLPQVKWVEEENFHLPLLSFGKISDLTLSQIEEQLSHLLFSPFSITLKGMKYFPSQRNRGVISIKAVENSEYQNLKKEVDRLLRNLQWKSCENFYPSHILLGYYETVNSMRLGEFLQNHSEIHFFPFKVECLQLLRSIQTPKRNYFDVIDEFDATEITSGKD